MGALTNQALCPVVCAPITGDEIEHPERAIVGETAPVAAGSRSKEMYLG